jgi:hypothetical protein
LYLGKNNSGLPGYVQGMSRVCPGYVKGMTRVCPGEWRESCYVLVVFLWPKILEKGKEFDFVNKKHRTIFNIPA